MLLYKFSDLLIENDFIYLLISAKQKASVTEITKKLKGIKGKQLLQEYAEREMHDNHINQIFLVSADSEVIEQEIHQ